jgi:CRISPR-associated endoribonuclease Cas6
MTPSIPANPDLIACVLRLHALEQAELERTQGHRAHGLFLELMRGADPALAVVLHEQAATKPFTVAPLQSEARRLRPGSAYTLRITLLRGDLFAPFARSFFQQGGHELQLGAARFALREVLITPGAHAWSGATTWTELLHSAQPAEELTLHFVTPTAFTLGTDAAGRKQIGLFPEPSAVFGSLLRRWNELAPAPLPADLLVRVTILPSRYDVHTEMLQFAKSPQLGFVGRCTYELRGDAADRYLLDALARASFFLGIGYKTTQGMGLVRKG